jgi:hypothetical protein
MSGHKDSIKRYFKKGYSENYESNYDDIFKKSSLKRVIVEDPINPEPKEESQLEFSERMIRAMANSLTIEGVKAYADYYFQSKLNNEQENK